MEHKFIRSSCLCPSKRGLRGALKRWYATGFTRHLSAAFVVVGISIAQVTTSTLVGLVRDAQNAVIPGATVVATHEGTGVSREGVSDGNGEFVFSALPAGPYTVKIELTGFKALLNRGMQLGAGQTVRQTFTLEVGQLAETVTVAGEAPLIETAASLQSDSLGSQEVRELPVNRRNLTNLMSLPAGVNVNGDGMVQMNGVAAGGTGSRSTGRKRTRILRRDRSLSTAARIRSRS